MPSDKSLTSSFLPLFLIFLATTSLLFLAGTDTLAGWSIDRNAVLVANLILFLATAISFYLNFRSLQNNNVHAFLRFVYGGMFAKMLICLFAAFIYISSYGKSVSKGAVFASMFLYFLYTFTEVSIIMKLSRKNRNGEERSPN
jgi:hypothetical protein